MANNMVKYVKTTSASFKALETKDIYTLYFLEDTGEIYKGSKSFTESCILVDSFPSTGAQGKIYILNTTLEGRVWNGTEWKTVIEPLVKTITDGQTQAGPVTADAVKEYVTTKFGEESGNAVESITFDKTTKDLQYVKNGKTVTVPVDGFLTGASYAEGVLSFNIEGTEEPIKINLPKDNFVQSGIYDNENKKIVLTLVDGSTVEIPASDLVDVYTVGETKSVKMSLTGNNITANVKVSVTEGNAITTNEDGLFVPTVDVTGKLDKVAQNKVDEIITAQADGTVKTSGVKVGGTALAGAPNANTLATEAAVNAIKTSLEQSVAAKLDSSKVSTVIPTENASDEKVLSEKAVVDALNTVKNDVVAKTSIATIIGETPANDKILSEKAVVDAISWTVLN